MDDGTYNKSYYSFATASFSDDEHVLLKDLLFSKFGLSCSIHGTKYKSLCITASNASNTKFKALVEPYIIPSMRYKVDKPVSPADL